jgi:hypothetical protein
MSDGIVLPMVDDEVSADWAWDWWVKTIKANMTAMPAIRSIAQRRHMILSGSRCLQQDYPVLSCPRKRASSNHNGRGVGTAFQLQSGGVYWIIRLRG